VLIYLDVETTGLEEKDRICALGCIGVEEESVSIHSERIKPPCKIRPEAMALHHITNEMVKDAPCFEASQTLQWLQSYNMKENILIAHNIEFDTTMLSKEGFIWQGGMIDTLKCTKHLIAEVDQFALQFLRYELGLYKTEQEEAGKLGIALQAHTPLSDAFHVKMLHNYLHDLADDQRLQELTFERVLVAKFTFGKYNGHYIEEIAMRDPGYLEWMLNNMSDMDMDLRYSVEHYLKESR
jgi:DNA polymerase III epsilon subunit-like protein